MAGVSQLMVARAGRQRERAHAAATRSSSERARAKRMQRCVWPFVSPVLGLLHSPPCVRWQLVDLQVLLALQPFLLDVTQRVHQLLVVARFRLWPFSSAISIYTLK